MTSSLLFPSLYLKLKVYNFLAFSEFLFSKEIERSFHNMKPSCSSFPSFWTKLIRLEMLKVQELMLLFRNNIAFC